MIFSFLYSKNSRTNLCYERDYFTVWLTDVWLCNGVRSDHTSWVAQTLAWHARYPGFESQLKDQSIYQTHFIFPIWTKMSMTCIWFFDQLHSSNVTDNYLITNCLPIMRIGPALDVWCLIRTLLKKREISYRHWYM